MCLCPKAQDEVERCNLQSFVAELIDLEIESPDFIEQDDILKCLIPFFQETVSFWCMCPSQEQEKKATTDGACVVHTFGLSANVRRPRDKRKSCTHMSIRGYNVYESF